MLCNSRLLSSQQNIPSVPAVAAELGTFPIAVLVNSSHPKHANSLVTFSEHVIQDQLYTKRGYAC